MSATPTPWQVDQSREYVVRGPDGITVAVTSSIAAAEANAELIVKAVNSYQPMLEALSNLREMLTALMRACASCEYTEAAVTDWTTECEARGLQGAGAKADALLKSLAEGQPVQS